MTTFLNHAFCILNIFHVEDNYDFNSSRCNGNFLTVPFDRLDFGETSVLETFSNADVAIVDMTSKGQASLSYHVGVRHSLGMKDNFLLFRDENPEETISMKVS